MDIFLAGGGGNEKFVLFMKLILKMDIYLSQTFSRKEIMDLYLAGEHPVKNGTKILDWKNLNILESFYYVKDNKHFPRLIKTKPNFLLDSGAFTYMAGSGGKNVNFDFYIEDYANFINKYNIDKFFELDIDSIVGLKEVERLRIKLERLTGKQPIPVWHKTRGKEYFERMCDEYPYVAIGGIVTKEIPIKLYEKLFPYFIKTAHKKGCKIHGLGYTNIAGLHKYRFDSVDSTAWLYGNISGAIYRFDPNTSTMKKYLKPSGKRLKSGAGALNNFREWVRFMNYAKLKL